MPNIRETASKVRHPRSEGHVGDKLRNIKGVNRVAGLVGHGKTEDRRDAHAHQSVPLSELVDASQFAPPPKHQAFHGDQPSASASKPAPPIPPKPGAGAGAASTSTTPPTPDHHSSSPPLSSSTHSSPARPAASSRGIGGSVHVQSPEERRAAKAEEEARKGPPVPYRFDTTGLSTAGFAPPPKPRREERDEGSAYIPGVTISRTPAGRSGSVTARAPPSPGKDRDVAGTAAAAAPARASSTHKPAPPPRPTLPPRQNSHPDEFSASPPPAYAPATPARSPAASPPPPATATGVHQLPQASLQRLGQAGVSVPGLNIGRGSSSSGLAGQPTSPIGAPSAPAQTWSQKQAALSGKMAGLDISSEEAATGPRHAANGARASPPTPSESSAAFAAAAHKKAPPPPPKKKELAAVVGHEEAHANSHMDGDTGHHDGALPPPVPHSSRPK